MYLSLCIYGLLFFFYSFLGWLIESVKGLIETKKFVNRGFLIGPLCPIYGFGSLLILFLLQKYANDIITLFVLSVVVCSILEYFTSYIMEKLFKLRWWDYSNRKFNIEGRICLTNLMAFGVLGILLIHFINPFVLGLISRMSDKLIIVTFVILYLFFLMDIVVSYEIINKISDTAMSIKKDSTEEITEKVRKILVKKGGLYERINRSFNYEATEKMLKDISDKLKTKAKKTKSELEIEKNKKNKEVKKLKEKINKKKSR